MTACVRIIVFSVLVISLAIPASGVDYYWRANEFGGWQGGTGNYVDAANWDYNWTRNPAAVPPGPSDKVMIEEWDAHVWNNEVDSAQAGEVQVGVWLTRWGDAELVIAGGTLNISGNFQLGVYGYNDYGNGNDSGEYGNGLVNQIDGYVTVGGGFIVGNQGVGRYNLAGGTIKAEWFSMGTPTVIQDTDGSFSGFNTGNQLNIVNGKLLLAGNIVSLDPRVVGRSGNGRLVFNYEADMPGYTTITSTQPSSEFSDFNYDGIVNFSDYTAFAQAWLTEPGDVDFSDDYDLIDDSSVNMSDLEVLALDWLEGYYGEPRVKIGFNSGWRFYRGPVSADAPKNPSYDDSFWQSVHVPHNPPKNPGSPDPIRPCWNDPSGYQYEGVSWYRKYFAVNEAYQGNKVFIEFEAINTIADVWVNGTHLTTHYGGYLPFTVDVTDHIVFGAKNIIAVKADNTDNPNVPVGNASWLNWGGIYRDVWMHITDNLHVTDAVYADKVAGGGIFVTYPSVNTAQAQIQVKTHVKNEYAATKSCTVETSIVDSDSVTVANTQSVYDIAAGGEHTFTQSTLVSNPHLWHPDHPYLYTVKTQIKDNGTTVDSYETRIGIRRIDFSQTDGFEINGERLMFIGTNRLQNYPYVGYAMTNAEQVRDAVKFKEAGFEFVRMASYPHDDAFFDACDELGLMIMPGLPGFQHIGDQNFINYSYQDMRDMIRRHRNRPSVIVWELSLGETWWTDPTYTPTAMSIGHAEYPGDQCFVGGWKDIGVWGEPALYDIALRNADHDPSAWDYTGPLPLIINEYGSWRYLSTGHPSLVHRMDGEQAMLGQASNHQESLHNNRALSFLCGDGLWVGIDYVCYNDGLLDNFRLPKFSYYFYQSQRDPNLIIADVDSGPMVFIANHWTSGSPSDVKVFSNCEQVKLYINGGLVATRNPDTGANTGNLPHPPFTFTGLTWQAGELKAEGYISGELAATHIVNTPDSAESLNIDFDLPYLETVGDITFVYVSVLDSNGTVVPDASNLITLEVVGGPATIISPSQVQAEAGIATFLIRSTGYPGTITVSAVASQLITDTAEITSQ